LYNILLNKPRKRAAQRKKSSQSKLKPAADKMAVFAEVLKCGDAVLAASPISLSESLLSPLILKIEALKKNCCFFHINIV